MNRTKTEQDVAGFSLQMSWWARFAGRPTRLVVGVAYDKSDIVFDASTELGALDSTRLAVPGGVFVGSAFTSMRADTVNRGFYFSNTTALSDRWKPYGFRSL